MMLRRAGPWFAGALLRMGLIAAIGCVTVGLARSETPSSAAAPPAAAPPALTDGHVRSTVLLGTEPPAPTTPIPPPVTTLPGGDISLNFPAVDVHAVAQAVLGDVLGLRYSVDSSVHGPITLLTAHPIRKSDVLGVFEQALSASNFVLSNRAGVYTILPAAAARSEAPVVGPTDTGYGNETIRLKFVNAEDLRKILDPLVPGAISIADPAQNVLVVSGTSTQRKAIRELVAEFDVDWLRGMSFALFVPQRTDARLIEPELEKLLNAPGAPSAGYVRLIAMDQLNGILAISSQPQYLEDVRRFMEVLDREGESAERRLFVYKVQNGRAADLARVLDQAFGLAVPSSDASGTEPTQLQDTSAPTLSTAPPSGANGLGAVTPSVELAQAATAHQQSHELAAASAEKSGAGAVSITADETNNAILVFATPRDYALIEDALRKLDVPPLQVMIDASISEVTLNHALQYGIQWSVGGPNSNAALTQGTTNVPVRNFPGFSYLYMGNNVAATLNALATVTDVTVLSAPKLMVLNNHTATIEVGQEVPISTGSAVSTITSNAPIVNSIEYRDTGIILKVTPRVNSGGLVLLDIAQEVSDVASAGSTSTIDSPTIDDRKIATSVAVADGETLALGGLIKNEVTKGRSTIPLLGSIPVLGHLFGDTTGALVRTELVVLLTPHVVSTPADARAITEALRGKIQLAPPPPPPDMKTQPHVPY